MLLLVCLTQSSLSWKPKTKLPLHIPSLLSSSASPTSSSIFPQKVVAAFFSLAVCFLPLQAVDASSFSLAAISSRAPKQSPGWEMVRQKRTLAVKQMAEKGIIKLDTDDSGNQFLSMPWLPDKRVPYKQLPLATRLMNEVSAGAFGEISKDILLHAVDTLKTRKQASKKKEEGKEGEIEGSGLLSNVTMMMEENVNPAKENPLMLIKGLYAGFPIVFLSSIPQGGAFFLVKKSIIEGLNVFTPSANGIVVAVVPIVFSVMAYWTFRTPAEVIKTQVQTGQSENCIEAVNEFRGQEGGLQRLWRHYPVMLCLDIPFQVLNFAMLTWLSELVRQAGVPTNVWSRLFCGVTCGMVSAGVTCPVDVCKTRILARDKAAAAAERLALTSLALSSSSSSLPSPPSSFEDITSSSLSLSSAAITTSHPSLTSSPLDTFLSSNISDEMESSDGRRQQGNVAVIENPLQCSEREKSEEETTAGAAVTSIQSTATASITSANNGNVFVELVKIYKEEGIATLFLGLKPRLIYTGLANGIRLAAYGTSRMDLMMRSLDDL